MAEYEKYEKVQVVKPAEHVVKFTRDEVVAALMNHAIAGGIDLPLSGARILRVVDDIRDGGPLSDHPVTLIIEE